MWSPDSSRIAFLSDRDKKGQMQLYAAPSTGGLAHKLTNLIGYLTDPQWSPNGSQIALLFAETPERWRTSGSRAGGDGRHRS